MTQKDEHVFPLSTKVFVLLSGGLDSTTTLAIAANDFPDSEIEAVNINYGQRHACEMDAAIAVARHYGAKLHTVSLEGLLSGSLVDKGDENTAIPDVDYADLPVGISPTYVSFRNGTMLSVLAARAQAWIMAMEELGERAEAVLYCGVHADDGVAWAYPDCTPEFIGGMANAIHIGTYYKARLRAPLQYMSKADVVRTGHRLQVPFGLTWSCYKGEAYHCGTCPTCRSRKAAFREVGILDPTLYANTMDQEVI